MTNEDVTLSSGVILRVRAVPPLPISMAKSSIPPPPIPQVPDPNHEGEYLPNPYDPDYQIAVNAHAVRVQKLGQDVMLSLGTEVLSVPETFPGPESTEWLARIEELEQLGVPVDRKVPRLAWLQYCAIQSGDDINDIMKVINRKIGVREEDVREAEQSFRGDEVRRSDRGPAATNHSGDGDSLRGTVTTGPGDGV